MLDALRLTLPLVMGGWLVSGLCYGWSGLGSSLLGTAVGLGAVVGDEIWDQQSRVRIQLGPLTLEQYQDFLPGGDAHRNIRAMARFYAGEEQDVEIQLILQREEVPFCELKSEPGWQLGWTSWVKSGDFGRDPGDAVLELAVR